VYYTASAGKLHKDYTLFEYNYTNAGGAVGLLSIFATMLQNNNTKDR
jgi:hypothetical protein